MVEENFKKILFAMILTSLFAILIIGVAVHQGTIYGLDTSEIESSLSYKKFNSSLMTIEQTSENARKSFERQSIWSSIAGIVVTGIFDIAKSLVLMITYPFSLISGIMLNVLHVPSIVTNILVGLLILSIIFGIWKLLKLGE